MGALELRVQLSLTTSPYHRSGELLVISKVKFTPDPLSVTTTELGSIKTSHCAVKLLNPITKIMNKKEMNRIDFLN
jgi:hypothetical protein